MKDNQQQSIIKIGKTVVLLAGHKIAFPERTAKWLSLSNKDPNNEFYSMLPTNEGLF